MAEKAIMRWGSRRDQQGYFDHADGDDVVSWNEILHSNMLVMMMPPRSPLSQIGSCATSHLVSDQAHAPTPSLVQ